MGLKQHPIRTVYAMLIMGEPYRNMPDPKSKKADAVGKETELGESSDR